jgi:uncharacterized protein (DUF924 family)
MALFRTFMLMSSLTSSIPRLTFRTASRSFTHRRTMSSFRLDPSIFNATLYKHVIDIWLPGIDLGGEELDFGVVKRWFAGSADERIAFDSTCRDHFAHALEAIGPDHVADPTAEPFLDEIKSSGDDSQAAWTALSLTLLLDQMPRNIYRSDEGLRKVYNHYDRISYALAQSLLSSKDRVDLHPQWRNSAAHRMWFYMPLMHSEDIEAHKLVDEILAEAMGDMEQLEGHEASKNFLHKQVEAEAEHRVILDRFGRYPHRNGALGRVSTAGEKAFLDEGGATFGVAQDEKGSL